MEDVSGHDARGVRDTCVQEPWPAWTAVGGTALANPAARLEVRLTCRTATVNQPRRRPGSGGGNGLDLCAVRILVGGVSCRTFGTR